MSSLSCRISRRLIKRKAIRCSASSTNDQGAIIRIHRSKKRVSCPLALMASVIYHIRESLKVHYPIYQTQGQKRQSRSLLTSTPSSYTNFKWRSYRSRGTCATVKNSPGAKLKPNFSHRTFQRLQIQLLSRRRTRILLLL